ncbi:hypothetical protein F5Y16DRAFT_306506 [Xylariaceae sp. FL0255]|nr:hypothetical protein F5Y16DRAFT_306506 [Xylariaceae sp. FL0255]
MASTNDTTKSTGATAAVHLKAIYTAPNTSQTPTTLSSTPLVLPPTIYSSSTSESVAAKTTYLQTLRSATTTLQELINTELTARMAEDNAVKGAGNGESADASSNKRRKTDKNGLDEAAEEENYGEEVQGDDD